MARIPEIARTQTAMPVRQFRDSRLRHLVNSVIPFTVSSVKASTGSCLQARSRWGNEEEVYGLIFLHMLNVLADRFSLIDDYFSRGRASADKTLVEDLLVYLISNLPAEARLSGAGLTSSLKVEDAVSALGQELVRSHAKRLSSEEYLRLSTIQDTLTLGFIVPYLPDYVGSEFAKLNSVIDEAIQAHLGGGLRREDLRKLAIALNELERRGWDWVTPQPDFVAKYRRCILTVSGLFEATLEQLYTFPPFLVEGPNQQYATIVLEQPFLWIKRRELDFINSVKQRFGNITGDSLEKLLEDYLQRKQLVVDREPPLGMIEVERPHPHHFSWARSSITLSRNTREDIFSAMPNPTRPEIEIDLVANHPEGFSIVGEAKWVTRYENAEAAYYIGTDVKEAERDRLLALSSFLNRNPARKSEFNIPPPNPVIPAFISNTIGPMFADSDGVVKASPLEVMEVEPFYRLLKQQLGQLSE